MLLFASDEENIQSSIFMDQIEVKKAVIQWERFSEINRVVKTVENITSTQKRKGQIATAATFNLLQREQTTEEMKCPKPEKINKKQQNSTVLTPP